MNAIMYQNPVALGSMLVTLLKKSSTQKIKQAAVCQQGIAHIPSMVCNTGLPESCCTGSDTHLRYTSAEHLHMLQEVNMVMCTSVHITQCSVQTYQIAAATYYVFLEAVSSSASLTGWEAWSSSSKLLLWWTALIGLPCFLCLHTMCVLFTSGSDVQRQFPSLATVV